MDRLWKRWGNLFQEIEQNLETDPTSEIGMVFAKKWSDLVEEVYEDHPILSQKIWEGYKEGITPQNHPEYNMKVVRYIEEAMKKFKSMMSKKKIYL